MNKFERNARCLMWFMASLWVALLVGCGSGGNDPILGQGAGSSGGIPGAPPGAIAPGAMCSAASGPTIPTVTSSVPVNGDTTVTTSTTGVAGGGKSINASFSLPMNPATINSTSFTLTPLGGAALVPASVTLNGTNSIATLTTSAALLAGTSYTAVITQAAMSAAGTPLGCIYAWNFTTAGVAAAGPAGINLGLATPFALASAGGMTNTNPSKINGNVVLDPNQTCNATAVGSGNDFGAICNTGANKVTNNAGDLVITQIFPDTTTADAVIADLNAAWISIAPAAMPGATVLGCGTIGTGGGAGVGIGCALNATLPPGVYISATNSTVGVTGTLTLDAAGNGNAVWVFQVPSALTINVGSTIVLAGGAKASNIWWYVGSSATVNSGATAEGNILASATIAFGTLATSCGRLLSGAAGAGSLTLLSNTVSVPGHPNAPVGCQ